MGLDCRIGLFLVYYFMVLRMKMRMRMMTMMKVWLCVSCWCRSHLSNPTQFNTPSSFEPAGSTPSNRRQALNLGDPCQDRRRALTKCQGSTSLGVIISDPASIQHVRLVVAWIANAGTPPRAKSRPADRFTTSNQINQTHLAYPKLTSAHGSLANEPMCW